MTLDLISIKRQTRLLCLASALAVLPHFGAGAATFSEGQLKSFAMAALAINDIAAEWQPKIQAAESEDQAAAMLDQADSEMRQAIENTDGIGLEEYQNIMKAAQTDQELRGQIETLLKDVAPQ